MTTGFAFSAAVAAIASVAACAAAEHDEYLAGAPLDIAAALVLRNSAIA